MTPHRFSPRPGLKKVDRGIRKASPTYGRPVFLTDAEKAGGGLAVESASERLVSQLLGFDPNVRSFASQPMTIDLLHGTLLYTAEEKTRARKRSKVRGERSTFYTPDFIAHSVLGAVTALEVKTRGWDGDEAYQGKLLHAREVLRGHDIDFTRVVVPSSPRHPLLTNTPLLHQAFKRRDLRPNLKTMEEMQVLSDSGANTLGQFCSALGLGMRMAPVLIVCGALKVDVSAHLLKNDTPADLAFGDLDHLCIIDAMNQ